MSDKVPWKSNSTSCFLLSDNSFVFQKQHLCCSPCRQDCPYQILKKLLPREKHHQYLLKHILEHLVKTSRTPLKTDTRTPKGTPKRTSATARKTLVKTPSKESAGTSRTTPTKAPSRTPTSSPMKGSKTPQMTSGISVKRKLVEEPDLSFLDDFFDDDVRPKGKDVTPAR